MTGLYVHIPFCVRKCPYCSFYSHPGGFGEMLAFTEAVALDLSALRSSPSSKGINTIYIGGGTPTSLPVDCLRMLLDALTSFMDDTVEFTCEANPDSATTEKFEILKESGVNRLSLGVQSFSDEILKTLGRLHDSRTAIEAYGASRQIGFENISIDLMYGLPRQELTDWQEDLKKAIDLAPDHISFYGLSIEKGTKFERLYGESSGSERLPGEDVAREMYYYGIDALEGAGYRHYEISNFARPGFESMHNINYWNHGRYYAIGPSASGFDGRKRWRVVSETRGYIDSIKSGQSTVAEEETLSKEQLISEAVMLGLRLRDGIDLAKLSERFDANLGGLYSDAIHSLVDMGMLEREGDLLRLSRDGLFVSNTILTDFMLV